MNVFVQLIIYLIILLGMFITVITFFDKNIINRNYYVVDKKGKENIEIWLVTNNIERAQLDEIKCIIEKGDYESIYDITNRFLVKNKDVDM